MEGPFIHVAASAHHATVIEATLRLLGRREDVVTTHASLQMGPLRDVDFGVTGRRTWWETVIGQPLSIAQEAALVDDTQTWKRIREAGRNVMVWHGPHPAERLLALRTCWHLRGGAPLFEIVLIERQRSLPAFYDAVSLSKPDVIAPAFETRARIDDVEARAQEWERIRDESGEGYRELCGEELVELPVDVHDEALLEAAGDEWTKTSRVVGRVLADIPVGDTVLAWRTRLLLKRGALLGEGWVEDQRLPERVRRA